MIPSAFLTSNKKEISFFVFSLFVFIAGCFSLVFHPASHTLPTSSLITGQTLMDQKRNEAIAQARKDGKTNYSFEYDGTLPAPLQQ